jgi:DNA topoisomerase-1
MTEEVLQAYCVKCKTKRALGSPVPEFTKTGTPGTRGTCEVCGTGLFRMGSTPAHANLPRPEIGEKPRKAAKTGKATRATKKKKPASKKAVTSPASSTHGRLVIVESPAKARTIQRFLGKKYTVKASVGHVRDLLRSRLSVDVDNNFEPYYRVPNEKRQVVKEIKQAASKSKEIFLATDPDREGEAIAWHLMAAAGIDEKRVQRVVFHEITEEAVAEAFANPHKVDLDLVNAQQARRILDRLVGYNVTELLWDKVRNRLSAGRVQSIASHLVVEREREITAFVPEEFWSLSAQLATLSGNGAAPAGFVARLVKIGDANVDFRVEGDVTPHIQVLQDSVYTVVDVTRGTRQRRPSPPFTTSTLQQEASRRLNFNARRTMSVAQQLYEGIDIGTEQVGLITYMRTDSTSIAREAQERAQQFIVEKYGTDFAPATPPVYKTRTRNAQEAHEAIRPTRVTRTPDDLKSHLSRDQFKLYTLIWQRFVSSQMANAVYTTLRVDIEAGPAGQQPRPYLFRVSGSLIKFPGFLRVYEESRDADAEADEDEGRVLPELTRGEVLKLVKLLPRQRFTQPPVRYTEATLVKALEENGIGRPSTYAPTVAVIQNRDYVTREGQYLVPTETGETVNDLLVKLFPDIMSVNFTARLEAQLDAIAAGEQEWVPFLSRFYGPFARELAHARDHLPSQQQEEFIGRACPECGNPLVLRYGRYGKFIGCATYPECRYTEPWLDKIGVHCPKDGGVLVEKKTRRGRTFYGCANYPACDFTSWKRPMPQPCPNCGGLLVEHNRNHALCTVCARQFRRDELPEPLTEDSGSAS